MAARTWPIQRIGRIEREIDSLYTQQRPTTLLIQHSVSGIQTVRLEIHFVLLFEFRSLRR